MRKVLYILGQLNDEDVDWMARTGLRRRHDGAERLIDEGVPARDMFFVLGGEVVVTVAGVGEVARLGRGEVVGEMSFVDSAPPSASVVTTPGTLTLALDKRQIEARLAGDPGFAGRFYKALAIFLADRLRATTGRLRQGGGLGGDGLMEGELDEAILDQLSLAGARFERLLAVLSGEGGRG